MGGALPQGVQERSLLVMSEMWRTWRPPKRIFALACVVGLLLMTFAGYVAEAHTIGPAGQAGETSKRDQEHADPELLAGWRVWVHLTIQWVHLVVFALWLGTTAGALFFLYNPPLEALLFASWTLFLVLLATGTYNMEYSAGIPDTPSLLNLPLVSQSPFGRTYTIALAIKLGLYTIALVVTLAVTFLHLSKPPDEDRRPLRQTYLVLTGLLALLITAVTAGVLILHEAADLYPTALHPLGGVVGSTPPAQVGTPGGQPVAEDLRLFRHPAVLFNISVRWLHLLGFGLWLGGSVWTLVFGVTEPRRFLFSLWGLLALQLFTGLYHMAFSTPFADPPYFFRIAELSHFRFGRTYTLLMGVKHALVGSVWLITAIMTVRSFKGVRRKAEWGRLEKRLLGLNVLLGLAIAYLIIMILLVHEGVDHVL